MTSADDADRLAIAQSLMVEITARLEDLAALATDQQTAKWSDARLAEGIAAVQDLAAAHGRLLPQRPTRARLKT